MEGEVVIRQLGDGSWSPRADRIDLMTEFGKILIFLGVLLAVFGVILVFGDRWHLPMGRLPGDIVYRGKNATVYFPIVTSILISIALSVVLYLIGRFSR
jgi:hypothetical protein